MPFLKIHFYLCMSVPVLLFLSRCCRWNNCPKFQNIYFCYLWPSPVSFKQIFVLVSIQYCRCYTDYYFEGGFFKTIFENCWSRKSLDEQAGFQGQANTEVRPFRQTFSSWQVWLSGGCFPNGQVWADCFVGACFSARSWLCSVRSREVATQCLHSADLICRLVETGSDIVQ